MYWLIVFICLRWFLGYLFGPEVQSAYCRLYKFKISGFHGLKPGENLGSQYEPPYSEYRQTFKKARLYTIPKITYPTSRLCLLQEVGACHICQQNDRIQLFIGPILHICNASLPEISLASNLNYWLPVKNRWLLQHSTRNFPEESASWACKEYLIGNVKMR